MDVKLLVCQRICMMCKSNSCLDATQIVRVVVAGGLLKGTEGLLQATTHNQPRQQAAALAPIRSAYSISTPSPLADPCSALSGTSSTCVKMHFCWLVFPFAELFFLLLCPLVYWTEDQRSQQALFLHTALFMRRDYLLSCVAWSCLSWLASSNGSMFCLSLPLFSASCMCGCC